MKTKLKIFLVCIVSGAILLTATFFFFLKCYLFIGNTSNPPDIRDITSNTLSFFSAIATIIAGIIAAYLFNDWKEQHNKQLFSNHAINVATLLCNERRMLDGINFWIPTTKPNDAIKFQKLINNVFDTLESNMPQYTLFIQLSEDNYLYQVLRSYQKELSLILSANHDDPKKNGAKLNEIRDINKEAIEILKSYIFIK